MTGTEWYATIYACTESPLAKGVLWAGSDDGLIHLSRDGGGHWENVTPKGYGRLTRTAGIDASHFEAGPADAAPPPHPQGDYRPPLWKDTARRQTLQAARAGDPA